jgi:hypothetical protein
LAPRQGSLAKTSQRPVELENMNDRALMGAMFIAGVSSAVLAALAVVELGAPPLLRPGIERGAGARLAPPSVPVQETPPEASAVQAAVDKPAVETASVPPPQALKDAPAPQGSALPPAEAGLGPHVVDAAADVPAPPAQSDVSIAEAAVAALPTQMTAPALATPSSASAPASLEPPDRAAVATADTQTVIAPAPAPSTEAEPDLRVPEAQATRPAVIALAVEPTAGISPLPAVVSPPVSQPKAISAAQDPSGAAEDNGDSTGSIRPPVPAAHPAPSQPASSTVQKPDGERPSVLRRQASTEVPTRPEPHVGWAAVATPIATKPTAANRYWRGRERHVRDAERRMASVDWRHPPTERRLIPARLRWDRQARGELRLRRSPVRVFYGTPPVGGRHAGPVLIRVLSSRAGGRFVRTARIPLY